MERLQSLRLWLYPLKLDDLGNLLSGIANPVTPQFQLQEAQMRLTIILMTLSMFFSPAVFAVEPEKKILKSRTYINKQTCGQVVAGLEVEENQKQFAMLVGSFISGVNYARMRNSKMPLKNMLIVTEMYCRQNPEKPIMAALINLDRVINNQIALDAKQSQRGE